MLLQLALLGSVFFYVGPDTDVFTLNRLFEGEDEIIYVEPLVAFRNRDRIALAKSVVGPDNVENNPRIDRLFECEGLDCVVDPLTMDHIHEYARQITANLQSASLCPIADNALRGLHIHDVHIRFDRITLNFTSNHVRRRMTIYLQRIQELDPSIVRDANITTFSRLGVGPNGMPAKRYVCNHTVATLRIVTSSRNPCVSHSCEGTRVKKNPSCRRGGGGGHTVNNQNSYSIVSQTGHRWCGLRQVGHRRDRRRARLR